MATSIIQSADLAATLAKFNIRHAERDTHDEYFGAKASLIAAGLVRDDQFAADGGGISMCRGKRITGNCRKDETYIRTGQWLNGMAYVYLGVPVEVAKLRRAATKAKQMASRAKYRAEQDAVANQHVRKAQIELASMPDSAEAFRRRIVRDLLGMVKVAVNIAHEEHPWHGYNIDEESANAILIATDGLIEAVMASEVCFDERRHQAARQGHLSTIANADASFQSRLAKLTAPNASILEGEAS